MTVQTVTRPTKRTTPASGPSERRPRWLSYAEAADLCTLSVRSLKRLTAEDKLPCYVIGGKVLRLKVSDVEALIVPADECRGW
nr:helix-turn-helix domain-containing protein [Propionibacterium sp.]